ncbi:MAG: type II toxin-antitoxin system Phd/YefM family antitoxin [Armatimonadota bacterium]
MAVLKAWEARTNLYRLIDETAASHQPVLIIGKRHNAVLVSEDDWRSIQETLNLLSIPGMRESVLGGLNTPISDCGTEIEW